MPRRFSLVLFLFLALLGGWVPAGMAAFGPVRWIDPALGLANQACGRAMAAGGKTWLPVVDHVGTVHKLIDADTGAVDAEFFYGPFGETLGETGDPAALAACPFRFNTKLYDAEIGLYHYGYRYYDPLTAKWISRDPIREAGGINLSGFVSADPVNRVDPLGLHEFHIYYGELIPGTWAGSDSRAPRREIHGFLVEKPGPHELYSYDFQRGRTSHQFIDPDQMQMWDKPDQPMSMYTANHGVSEWSWAAMSTEFDEQPLWVGANTSLDMVQSYVLHAATQLAAVAGGEVIAGPLITGLMGRVGTSVSRVGGSLRRQSAAKGGGSSLGRLLYDPRNLKRQISPAYWSSRGPVNGRSLHHWLIPQRATWVPQGIRNAGWNLVELPALSGVFHRSLGLNQWMGFARNWGPKHALRASAVENAIRVGIPAAAAGAAYGGYQLGEEIGESIIGED